MPSLSACFLHLSLSGGCLQAIFVSTPRAVIKFLPKSKTGENVSRSLCIYTHTLYTDINAYIYIVSADRDRDRDKRVPQLAVQANQAGNGNICSTVIVSLRGVDKQLSMVCHRCDHIYVYISGISLDNFDKANGKCQGLISVLKLVNRVEIEEMTRNLDWDAA